jgi:hypothetical protein
LNGASIGLPPGEQAVNDLVGASTLARVSRALEVLDDATNDEPTSGHDDRMFMRRRGFVSLWADRTRYR